MANFFSNLGNSLSGGASGILGGITNGIFGLIGQRKQMAWQEEMMKQQQQFQSEEAQKQRDWSSAEADEARDWNSIASQLRRAQSAGVNPFSLVESGSYGSAAGAQAPSGVAASGHVSIPQPPSASQANVFGDAFNSVAQALGGLAQARKAGVDTTYLERTLDDRIRKMSAEADTQEAAAALEKLRARFKYETYDMSKEELNKKLQQQQLVIDELQFAKDMDYPQFKLWVSKAQEAFSAGQKYGAEAQFTRKVLTDYYNSLTGKVEEEMKAVQMSNEVRGAALDKEKELQLTHIEEQIKRESTISDTMKQALEMARKNNDWYTYQRILEGIGAASELIGGATKIGALIQSAKSIVERGATTYSTYGSDR